MSRVFRVLIVDDSTVFRSQLRAALDGVDGLDVAAFASNGKLALEVLQTKPIDLMVLDLEMPVMSGLETLREMRRLGLKTKVIVFSAHSKTGAAISLDALSLGASDLVTKPEADGSGRSPAELIRHQLLPKVLQFRDGSESASPVSVATPSASSAFPTMNFRVFQPKAVVIASSTGGPTALEDLFSRLRPPVSVPVFIAQHMPPMFTAALADRLAAGSDLRVTEAVHGEPVENGRVYVAPGDYHMRLASIDGRVTIRLDQEPQRNSVRPAADHLFESAVTVYGNRLIGLVLTGMGADGKDGAIAIKRAGGGVVIQNRESCVVFGMPGAVHDAGASDRECTLAEMVRLLGELGLVRISEGAA